jgi:hypothetical protein
MREEYVKRSYVEDMRKSENFIVMERSKERISLKIFSPKYTLEG